MNQKPKPRDLIEVSRVLYQHWAIYVGDGYVIHLVPPSEHAQAGSNSLMSVMYEKAIVKKEKLYEVVGSDHYCINNLLDERYEPRPVEDILWDAHRLLGKRLSFSVFTMNCEHFVTELRYGKSQSLQVQNAVDFGIAGGIAFGILALAVSTIFSLDGKQKQKK